MNIIRRNSIFKALILILMSISIKLSQGLEDPVDFSISVSPKDPRPGEVVRFNFDIEIDKNFHIYSTDTAIAMSPTYVEFVDSLLFKDFGSFIEPKPIMIQDTIFNMQVGKHVGSIKLTKEAMLKSNVEIGNKTLEGTLYYLACDPKKCINVWDDFSIELLISEGSPRSEYSSFYAPHKKKDLYISSYDELEDVKNSGLFVYILVSIAMGFLALLTPCVFPMIPITISFFTKMGEEKGANPFFSASIYALGIILIFTFLGFLLALFLGGTGARDLATNGWINLFIALLFVYFALSLLGHYDIQLPSFLNQFSQSQENRSGIIGILFMSLTFVLTSFTCTVGFFGFLLLGVSKGDFLWPLIGMLSFSTAFASPFFFLALFPQYLASLPKSGGWLNSVKVVMGFLELGAAMKFISNADMVWEWGIFTKVIVLSFWAIIAIIISIYLLGKIQLPHDSKMEIISVPRLLVSILFATFGIYLTSGVFGQPIHGLIDSYLPQPPIELNSKSNKNLNSTANDLIWEYDFDQALVIAKEQKKPIFIDFTGYTCTNCQWMEKNIFVLEPIQEMFKNFVLVKLYTDGGPNYKKNRELEINRFNTVALPFYVILSHENEEITRFHGMDPDDEKFLTFLKEGGKRYF